MEELVRLRGHVQVLKNDELIHDIENTISVALKGEFRDAMNGAIDIALDNLFTTDELKGATGGSVNQDGIMYLDDADSDYGTMVTVVHASDPSGNYYRQWTGVLTASGVIAVDGGIIGHDLVAQAGPPTSKFNEEFATVTFAVVNLVGTDTLTIHWKISIS